MALDFSKYGTPVEDQDEQPDFSKFGTPVDEARRELSPGSTPSTAGAGRGSVNPPSVEARDDRGIIQRVGDFLRPEYKSVLEGVKPTPQETQAELDRRLSYGAGPISRETVAKADFSRSGMLVTDDKTVNKVAAAMQEKGQPSFADFIERANDPSVVRAAREAKADEFRTAGEWAVDTLSGLAQGGTSLVQLPTNIIAPGSVLAQSLRDTQKELQAQESGVLKAQRDRLRERVENEEGFLGKYFATVESLVTNPALSLSEATKQVPNFLGVMGLAKVGGVLAGETIGLATRASPTVALSEAISGNALQTSARMAGTTAGGLTATTIMTSGDAAGNVYETLIDPKKTPRSLWEQNPDYQKLIAAGKSPAQAIDEIATAKARLAALIVAPLGVFGFMGAEATIASRGAGKILSEVATPKGAAKVFGKELFGEQIEEGGTQFGGNVITQTVNPQQKLLEGVPEAMATAAVTSAPFSAVAVGQQVRDELNRPAPVVDQQVDALVRRAMDVQSYDANIISPTQTARVTRAQSILDQATTVEDMTGAAEELAGNLNEMLVPDQAVTPLPVITNEPMLTSELPPLAPGRIEPTLTNEPLALTPGPDVNVETEQQFGLDKLRMNAPRPQSIQGKPASSLTDDELSATIADSNVSAITRRSAEVELKARQAEQAPPTTATTANAPAATTTATEAIPDVTGTLGSTPVRGGAAAPVSELPGADTARANAQRSIDRWATSQGVASPIQFNPAPAEETAAVSQIGQALNSQFGTRLFAYHDTNPTAPNGVAIAGTAFVNTANVAINVGRTSLHEFKHTIEQIAKAEADAGLTNTPAQQFTTQIDSIFDDMTDAGKRAYVENFLHADELAGITDPAAREARVQELIAAPMTRSEMTADFLGSRATDKKFWADVAKADPQGFKGFVDKWLGIIDGLLAKLRGRKDQGKYESARVDKYVQDLNRAKMVARDALVAYRKGTLQHFEGVTNGPANNVAAGNQNIPGIATSARPELGQAGRAEVPSYGTGRQGAISVVGRHYSSSPQQSLSGAYYGRGLKGAERNRLDSSTDPRLKNRIYFYVDQGSGIRPESGVGGYAHEVKLDNIYDPQTGTIRPQADLNGFESAVINAGFDGYIAPFGNNQAAVVLLGQKHKAVPVAQIGQPASAPLPQTAAPTTLKKGLLSREANTIDVSKIPGAKLRMGSLEIPAEQTEAANAELERIGSDARFSAKQSNAATLEKELSLPTGVTLSLEDYTDSEVELANLEAVEQNQGAGSEAMRQLTRAADRNGVNLMLIPAGNEAKRERLADFYGRFGFQEDGDVMRRPAAAGPSFAKKQDIPESIDNFARLENIIPRARAGSYTTNRELKVALQTAILAAAKEAKINLAEQNAQTEKYLTRVGVADAIYALQANANAVGWYDKTVTKALKVLGKIHPEINTDPNAKFAFTWALAVTSNGLKVDKNFELAEQAYRAYKNTGQMPTNIEAGQAQGAINKSLDLFNQMVAQYGIDNVRKFMDSKFAVSQIKRATGLAVTGEFAETLVRGAAVLGPKIGNGFYANLNGFFDQLTMDRWLMRTWGRWTGTLIESRPDMVKLKRQELRDFVVQMKQNAPAAAEFQKALGAKLTVGDLDGLAKIIQKASMDPDTRQIFNKTPAGEGLRLSGNSLAKYLDGQKEAPDGPEERNFIRKVFSQILKEVQKEHPALTMSDLQALLWYPEKRLYDIAKSDESANQEEGYSDDEAPDYANAASKLARDLGVSDADIQSAGAEAEKDYASRISAGTTGRGTVGQATPGTAPAARGFAERESREFLTTGVVRGIRSAGTSDEGQPNSYTRKSGGDGKGLRVLNLPSVAVYSPATVFKNALAEIPVTPPKFFEIGANGASTFRDAIQEAKANSRFGAAVYVYPVDEYAGMRLFLTEDGKAGFALKGDDIVSVFAGKEHPGAANSVLQLATQEGGRRLDAFDTVLPNMYALHGFRAVARTKWNDDYAPDGWNKDTFKEFNNGKPDVVFMVHDPEYFDAYTHADGPVIAEYDDGAKAQAEALANIKQVRQTDPPKPVSALSIFTGLDKRGLAKAKAETLLAEHPDSARIKYVQENFLDILSELEDSDLVKINCD